MGSVLVVANQTLGGEALSAHLRRVIEADPSVRFVVVVPVATPQELGERDAKATKEYSERLRSLAHVMGL